MDSLSVYIHIPFCVSRCNYCDFVSSEGRTHEISAYANALIHEITCFSPRTSPIPRIHTVFFGGGTPSLLPTIDLERIMITLKSSFIWEDNIEISLEANPATIHGNFLDVARELGINRISLGGQSFNENELQILGRRHTGQDISLAFTSARASGFNNLNVDLIYGIPQQTRQTWEHSLNSILSLHPEHISLYPLTLEEGTRLYRQIKSGFLSPVEEDDIAEMYETAIDFLSQEGYDQYEISNCARKTMDKSGWRCRHNLQYWRNRPYIGFGAGAHSSLGGFRFHNTADISSYIVREIQRQDPIYPASFATVEMIPIDRETEMKETMMLGLRLVQEGVHLQDFYERFGIDFSIHFSKEIHQLCNDGLVAWDSKKDRLCLTRRGFLLGNFVFREFV